jgi:DNA-binding PadR family transcriptional regulator
MMPLPPLSSLQFLVLDAIGGRERSGREVRAKLAEQAQRRSLPSFYELMARLEDVDFVKGSYRPIMVEDQPVRERVYKLTGKGIEAYNETREFYSRSAAALKGGLANG